MPRDSRPTKLNTLEAWNSRRLLLLASASSVEENAERLMALPAPFSAAAALSISKTLATSSVIASCNCATTGGLCVRRQPRARNQIRSATQRE
jgi:hypothetical protein